MPIRVAAEAVAQADRPPCAATARTRRSAAATRRVRSASTAASSSTRRPRSRRSSHAHVSIERRPAAECRPGRPRPRCAGSARPPGLRGGAGRPSRCGRTTAVRPLATPRAGSTGERSRSLPAGRSPTRARAASAVARAPDRGPGTPRPRAQPASASAHGVGRRAPRPFGAPRARRRTRLRHHVRRSCSASRRPASSPAGGGSVGLGLARQPGTPRRRRALGIGPLGASQLVRSAMASARRRSPPPARPGQRRLCRRAAGRGRASHGHPRSASVRSRMPRAWSRSRPASTSVRRSIEACLGHRAPGRFQRGSGFAGHVCLVARTPAPGRHAVLGRCQVAQRLVDLASAPRQRRRIARAASAEVAAQRARRDRRPAPRPARPAVATRLLLLGLGRQAPRLGPQLAEQVAHALEVRLRLGAVAPRPGGGGARACGCRPPPRTAAAAPRAAARAPGRPCPGR